MSSTSVSSGEFLKSYGRFVEVALREPLTITNHGRERLVLLSADEYRRLKEKDRQPVYPWELSPAEVAALEAAEPPAEAAAFSHETVSR